VVVGASRKQDLSRVEFIETARSRPQVHGGVVFEPEDDFRCTIESTDKVRCRLVLRIRASERRAQVTHLGVHKGYKGSNW
jgi:hypothetical protein